jgi:3-dehydroquinate dehydratase type I
MVEDNSNIGALMQDISTKKPDLVEVRLDKLHDRKLIEEIVTRKSFPIIATDKSDRDQHIKLSRLLDAATLGFDFVDIDYVAADAAQVKQMKSKGAEVILSFHDYSRTPSKEELARILETQKSLGGDISKLVTTAFQPRDNLTILDFLESQAASARLVSFAMGREGIPSRILSPFFGAEFTFAALSNKTQTAEGQLGIDELRSAWNILGLQ